MHPISLENMSDILTEATNHNLCVRAWLGHADVLFIGFGEQVLPGLIIGNGASKLEQPEPPYQLRTYLSNWRIEHEIGMLGSSYDDERAWAAVTTLLGHRAIGWRFLNPTWGLVVDFEDGLTLVIDPYEQPEFVNRDAWGLRDTQGFYSIMKCNGQMYKVHVDEPTV